MGPGEYFWHGEPPISFFLEREKKARGEQLGSTYGGLIREKTSPAAPPSLEKRGRGAMPSSGGELHVKQGRGGISKRGDKTSLPRLNRLPCTKQRGGTSKLGNLQRPKKLEPRARFI